MLISRFVIGMISVVLIFLGAGVVSGQGYPNKPIRIVASDAGGGGDFAARLIAQGLIGSLGQQVIIENRSALIAIETVAKASPNGYTVLLTSGTMWTLPFLQKVSYDPARDFSAITSVTIAPNILVVHPSLPVKSVKELIALAKARPGELNYSSAAVGSTGHLAAELFKAMASLNIVHIPYKSAAAALNDLIGGQVLLITFGSVASVAPHVKAGKLNALAVTTARPSALLPDLPTVAASGLPGYECSTVLGMFAPAGTPASLSNRLHRETARVLATVEVKERFLTAGAEPVGSTPAEFAVAMKSDMIRLSKLIKDVGIRTN